MTKCIRVDGQECWTLFDTRARNTYVNRAAAKLLATKSMAWPVRTRLNDEVKETSRSAILNAEVEGHPVSTHAFVVDQIETDSDDRSVEILFGALAMKQWGIRPIPDENRLDLTNYPDVFVEY